MEDLVELDPLTGEIKGHLDRLVVFPGSHYVTPPEEMKRALVEIKKELTGRLKEYEDAGEILKAQRLEQRCRYDIEMLELFGHCKGIENYSRHLDGRKPGSPPSTLIDYFPPDFITIVDESHVSLPQIRAMAAGDASRKNSLVDYGFRLPCARDNRPLTWPEWLAKVRQKVFVSATPGDFELDTGSKIVELIVRPTGLVDPPVDIRPVTGQVDDLIEEIRKQVEKGHRTLVGTLTRRMAEELTDYLGEVGIRTRYMHADVVTLDRIELLQGLRMGSFDVLVGINLLREGLDLPEVSLVAVLDADREGFLRGTRSLVQVSGRAARNVEGRVIFYADKITKSIRQATSEMERRRKIQLAFNEEHGITPQTIEKPIMNFERALKDTKKRLPSMKHVNPEATKKEIKRLEVEMFAAARELEYELAAQLRDDLHHLQALLMEFENMA